LTNHFRESYLEKISKPLNLKDKNSLGHYALGINALSTPMIDNFLPEAKSSLSLSLVLDKDDFLPREF